MMGKERHGLLWETVAALPEEDQEALILRFKEELSIRDIAGIIGLGEEGAKKRVMRAIRRLRQALSEYDPPV
jgi:RNA polymerase sigma factor (sigma-70 family)